MWISENERTPLSGKLDNEPAHVAKDRQADTPTRPSNDPIAISNPTMDLKAFTDRFYELMPRELRDIVYGFLLDELNETWKVVDDGSIVSKPCITKPLKKPRVIQYLSHGLIKEEMAREMVEEFFLYSKFEIEHPCPGLRSFLYSHDFSDTFEARNFVRKISVNLHLPEWVTGTSAQVESRMDAYLQGLGLDIELLFTIAHPQKCSLKFHLGVRFLPRKLHLLRFMAPYARRAQDLGFRFELYVERRRTFSFLGDSLSRAETELVRFEEYEGSWDA